MKYPGINRTFKDKTALKENHSKRGMSLEKDINTSNKYYLNNDIAVIYKKPTPIKLVKVSYPKRSKAKICDARFKERSTTDYNGIYKGKYIDFEAKECHSKTSFPFTSIHKHQIEHLKKVEKHGALSFLIIKMCFYGEVYLIKSKDFINYYNNNVRKSLPYEWIKNNGFIINGKYTNPCDYIKSLEIAFKKELENE